MDPSGPVIALAGRRIDAPDAPAVRFPLAAVPQVEARIEALFREVAPRALVASAACGADLVAHEVAGRLGIPRTVVLPFGRARFRSTSVDDRPGEWGALYEQVLDAASREGGVLDLDLPGDDTAAYSRASEAILDRALAAGGPVIVVVAWEGTSRGGNDHSLELVELAGQRGVGQVREVRTTPLP